MSKIKIKINNRSNFCFNKITSSLMYLMLLGGIKSVICLLLLLVKVFDIDKILLKSITNNMKLLRKIGIDFLPKETLKDDKTIG